MEEPGSHDICCHFRENAPFFLPFWGTILGIFIRSSFPWSDTVVKTFPWKIEQIFYNVYTWSWFPFIVYQFKTNICNQFIKHVDIIIIYWYFIFTFTVKQLASYSVTHHVQINSKEITCIFWAIYWRPILTLFIHFNFWFVFLSVTYPASLLI